ncbi:exodeoxyribonuclease V subunit alpha [Chromatocurvus halotolerans]|uniref:RecBCD enzyme subunit RecD n=1 Tax=Chromatocurvus halotolerans TaxID=1132028 RepID=A0A4R2KV56_9GAMM|nr:exodeoxyribonuclease V subunit alpha [Chromatocurvus halotolerans]TCO76717.1 DNA helicase/exodeoxyribonuclease V alpha subunit [Chromatocurvus halotolerans]
MSDRKTLRDSEHLLEDPEALLLLVFAWAEAGWVRDLDAALAHRLFALAPDGDAACLLAAVMVSFQAGQGHLLLDLDHARRQPRELIAVTVGHSSAKEDPPPPDALLSLMPASWESRLRDWTAVGEGEGSEPLVLDNHRLYLRRYWRHEAQVSQALAARFAASTEVHAETLRAVLDRLFPLTDPRAEPARWQKLACALGARSAFTVITGGPGTGKTTTVIRLLALLQVLALESGEAPLRIRLAAPTGKAAARLNEAISGQVGQLAELDLPRTKQVRESIPSDVTTLHRLLGARPDTRHFKHHRFNPLSVDVVVVDEASMIDIEMMSALLAALPARARLVLLGDKDQLASVEAGAVLGSLCARAEAAHYRPELARWLQAASGWAVGPEWQDSEGLPLDQAVAMLRHSFRFDDRSGIGELARAVNVGDSARAMAVLADEGFADVQRLALDGERLAALAIHGRRHDAAGGYSHYLGVIRGQSSSTRPAAQAVRDDWDRWALSVLEAHAGFQLLTPLRSGPHGVAALNTRIERELEQEGLIARTAVDSHWYEGRPVLVTGNDYGLGLMNGDVGIALQAPVEFGAPGRGLTLRVAFSSGDGRVRWVLPSRLQRIETVFAMTVHKSQGSEFAHTALVMPELLSPVLTRELVYTAVTRAKNHFTLLCGSNDVFAQAVERRVARQSQLTPAGTYA